MTNGHVHRLGHKTVIFIHTISTPHDPACKQNVQHPNKFNLKTLMFLQRTPTSDQENKNHRNMFNVRCKSENYLSRSDEQPC